MTRAEELRILAAAYTNQLKYLAEMADPETPKTPLQLAEDSVSLFFNGGTCTKHTHEAATDLEKLVMLRMLRLDLPHVSTSPADLDVHIRHLIKKARP